MRKSFLPFHIPSISSVEIDEVTQTLKDAWITSGPRVRRFEEQFASFVGAEYAVALNSCTAALHLGLEAMGVGPDDEVVVPAMTFAAAAEVVVHLGARPVFADVDPESLLMTPDNLEREITGQTKVVLPVHHSGLVCDIQGYRAVTAGDKIKIFDDAAHALPSRRDEQMVGNLADATAFSFYSTKTLATGEGGMFTTSDQALARRVRLMSCHGMTSTSARFTKEGNWAYDIAAPGFKYNMPELIAAMGIAQLSRQKELHSKRQKIAEQYLGGLKNIAAVKPPVFNKMADHSWHLFVIRLDCEQLSISRDEFINKLKEMNIGASVHFTPLYRHTAYMGMTRFGAKWYPGAEKAYGEIISLPIWPEMTEQDVADVLGALELITREYRR